MTSNSSCALGLLDVLEQLPQDVLRADLWLQLSEPSDLPPEEPNEEVGRAFRLVSQRSLHLSDQLTRRLRLFYNKDSDAGHDEDLAVASRGAFLARQVGLDQLMLVDNSDTNGDSLVIKTLLLGGDAVSQRLQVLHIDTGGTVTRAAGRCLQMCCPNLHELMLRARDLDRSLFLHLRHFQALTKLTICTRAAHGCGEVLRSLAALPGLRTLTVQGTLLSEHIPLLGHLTGLEELNTRNLLLDAAPDDGARLGLALARLTRLTQLVTLDCGAATHSVEVLDSALAQLGTLQRLSALSCEHSVEGPALTAGLSALCRLSALTRLACTAAREQHPVVGNGRLLLLQNLRIRGDASGQDLAATLRALLPLPLLRHFLCNLSLALDLDDDETADASGQEAAGAWQAATLLAGLPHLEGVGMLILGPYDRAALLLGPATALLTPLQGLLTQLRLVNLPAGALDVLLPLMCMAGRLQLLSLQNCRVADSWLPLAAQRMSGLRHLQLHNCDGVTAASAVALAALRVQPLHLVWLPELDAEEVQQFKARAHAGVTVGSEWLSWDSGDF